MSHSRRAQLLICGLGLSLFLSWPYCVFSMSSLFVEDAHGGILNNLCWVISLTTLILTFGIDYILGNRLEVLFKNPVIAVGIAAIQTCANISMTVGGSIAGSYGEIVVITGAAVTGFATGYLHLCWGRRLGDFTSHETIILVPVSYVGAFVETLLVSLLPHEMRFLAVIGMILTAGLLLGFLTYVASSKHPSDNAILSIENTLSKNASQPSIFSKVLTVNDYVTMFFCFVCVSLVQDIYNPQRMVDSFMFAFVMLIAALVSIVFVEVVLRISREITYNTVIRMLVPFCCLGLFLATCLPQELTFVAFALVFSSMMASVMFFWISGVVYQFLTPGGIARSLGLLLIIHYGGAVSGTLAVPLFSLFGETNVLFFLVIVLSSLVILRSRKSEDQEPIIIPHYQDIRPEAVKRITEQFGLTEREAEIFDLYAKGRDSAYICQTCFISKNTVDTHLRHIYEKTNIRTKQGLIDLVEEAERDLEDERSM